MGFEEVEREMDAAVERRVFPGAVLLVREGTRVFYHRAFGHRSIEPEVTPMTEDTIFDVASLTKPFATSIAMMLLVKEGKVALDDRVTRFFHNFGVHGKTHITFRHLLSHCSGLPAYRPYYKDILQIERHGGRINFLGSPGAKAFVYQQIHRERLEQEPGRKALYSDLDFMLIGAAIEEVGGMSLDRFCHERIFRPLGVRSTGFIDLSQLRARRLEPVTEMIAPTQRCPWRKKILCGEVDDDNAYAMGGVAGHAGLFASAKDLDALLGRLNDCYHNLNPMIPQRIVQEFWTRNAAVPDSTWCLGWDTPSPQGSSAGSHFSPHSVGHLGFTGTSVWLDLEHNRHVLLLSNRVHPNRDNDTIRAFRPFIHDLIVKAVQ
ncbi:MAG TPA: serine hydrolase domain-containing protein [Candidatus Acidoferrales bacterium]|nr:serine hydrolase domain-containing protein [Candidatus Acidoferrales bacterium]